MSRIPQIIDSIKALFVQPKFDVQRFQHAKSIVLFLLPPAIARSGGVLSIFSLCKTSRELLPDSQIAIATFPGKYTYAKVEWFKNDENIYRFSQVINSRIRPEKLYIHIPEYLAGSFVSRLSSAQKALLKSIPQLHINILNQNIDMMPSMDKLTSLFELTGNITQTTAHDRYADQEMCNKWYFPLHHFSVDIRLPHSEIIDFEKKKEDKIILLSPDTNTHRDTIVDIIAKKLPDYKIITIKNMSYHQYSSLLSKCMFCITFGEGFDSYFLQPFFVQSIGIAVYNDRFFPGKEWIDLDNIYTSYEKMAKNIADRIRSIENDKEMYTNIISQNRMLIDRIYSIEKYKDNIMRFYDGRYDFHPSGQKSF